MNGDLDVYGLDAASVLSLAQSHLAAVNDDFMDSFYDALANRNTPKEILNALRSESFQETQPQTLLSRLIDPHLNAQVHERAANRAGHQHALVGIDGSHLVAAYGQSLQTLLRSLPQSLQPEEQGLTLQELLTTRLMTELSHQIRGQQQVLQQQQRVVVAIMHLLEQPMPLNDLIRVILETMTSLEGMMAGTLARPDEHGNLQYEMVVGKTFETHAALLAKRHLVPTIHAGTPNGEGPSGRAWRSGQVQTSLYIFTDPTLVPWYNAARELGYVSQANIPIADAEGRTQAILTLYHSVPGYFRTTDRLNIIDRLCWTLRFAYTRLTHSTPVLSHTIRADYRGRLVRGDLIMLYQPVIDLANGELEKVEALARLVNSDGSYASPGEFLPAFGGRDLRHLFALGLRQALTDLHQWESQGLKTSVAVNLPAQALTDPEYLTTAQLILKDIPTDTKRLTLELLETDEIDPRQSPVAILAKWRALGVRLAQDDLGSGYSSLLRMDRLAVDDVKIDQGLVSTAAQAPHKALQFIHHLTSLVHDLGIQVVVEGLESFGLIEAAAILGADAGQGYAIGRPMRASALRPWKQHFSFNVDVRRPQTALGVYAAMVLHNALISLAKDRPDLLKSVMAEPSALSHYLSIKRLQTTVLGEAHKELRGLASEGPYTSAYTKTRQKVEALLCARIQAEESTPTPNLRKRADPSPASHRDGP